MLVPCRWAKYDEYRRFDSTLVLERCFNSHSWSGNWGEVRERGGRGSKDVCFARSIVPSIHHMLPEWSQVCFAQKNSKTETTESCFPVGFCGIWVSSHCCTVNMPQSIRLWQLIAIILA